MSTQQGKQKPTRRVVHKHLRVGEWLICIDRELDIYDAVFLSRDNRFAVYPTTLVKQEIGDKLPKAFETIIGEFTTPYKREATLVYADMLREQMRRISSTKECHEFVNGLMCLAFEVCPEGYGKRLCDTTWFNEDAMYRRIYDVLSTENMLPNPCDVTALPPQPVPPGISKGVRGVCFRALRKIWFRHTPPEYMLFAHELIHLIPGKRFKTPDADAEDELYAYHLSPFVVELAKRGIKPPVNPVRLFEIDNTTIILEATREVYNYEFKDLIEFFKWLGEIPIFPKPSGVDDPAKLEEVKAEFTIFDLIEGSEHDEREFEVLVRLLDKLSQKTTKAGW